MNPSAKWQKIFKWYCIVSCLAVGLAYILTLPGDSGWGTGQEWLRNIARVISYPLFAATITGADLLLWLISLGIWFPRRRIDRLGPILGWGLAMVAAKLLNCATYVVLTDNIG